METAYSRLGLWLFGLYLVLYGGFVFLSAFVPDVMAITVNQVNLATIYGFGLIIAAFIMALIYGVYSKNEPAKVVEPVAGSTEDQAANINESPQSSGLDQDLNQAEEGDAK